MTKRIVLAAAFSLHALASPAFAQAPFAAQDQKGLEDAKALSHQAEIDYKLGRFEASLTEYSAAYEKSTPLLLLDIGQCHRMLKAYEQAILFYKGYLRDKPDASNRSVVEGLIDEAQKNLDAQKSEAAAARDRERERRDAVVAGTPLPVAPSIAAQPAEAAAETGLGTQKAVAIAAGGVGLAGLAIGVALGAVALSERSAAESVCPGTLCASQDGVNKWSVAAASGNISTVGLVVGAIGVAGGVVLWVTAPRPSRGPTASVGFGPGMVRLKGAW